MKTILEALGRTATGPSVAAATIHSPCTPCPSPLTTDPRSPITGEWSQVRRACYSVRAGWRPLPCYRVLSSLCPLSSVLFLLLTGCTHLGPKTVAVERFDYSTAIADSWKQQTLLNLVKLRDMDMPVFVDVASIGGDVLLHAGRHRQP